MSRAVLRIASVLVLAATPVVAQPAAETTYDVPSAARVVDQFSGPYSPERIARGRLFLSVLLSREDRSVLRVDSVLDGLEALGASSPDRRIRMYATAALASAGSTTRERPPGVLDRLERLYRAAPDGEGRRVIPLLASQAPRPHAISLLRDVATAPPSSPWSDAASLAISTLEGMGEDGRRALRDLHAQGRVTEPRGATHLQQLAERGFQAPARGVVSGEEARHPPPPDGGT